jgi:hypothetical protein
MTLPWDADLTLDHVEEFLGGLRLALEPTRVLATVLFTDIVSSTEQAARVGDRRWRELLDVHDELARRVPLTTPSRSRALAPSTTTSPTAKLRSPTTNRSGPSWPSSARSRWHTWLSWSTWARRWL